MNRRDFLFTFPLLAAGTVLAAPGGSSLAPATSTPAKPAVPTGSEPTVRAAAAILIDYATGKILFNKSATEKRPVASTQKLLTALIICESANLDRICTVEEYEARAEPTKMFLKTGTQYNRRELLKALLMKSANDTAMCLARNHAGSEDAFAGLMNRRAALLGMRDSSFKNASGLPAEQYSTAYDMALLARVAIQQPVIRAIVSQRDGVFNHADGKPRKMQNTNELLRMSPYCRGMKTGFTNAAGKCLVGCATDKSRTVISVVLGSSTKTIWKESMGLLHWGLGVS